MNFFIKVNIEKENSRKVLGEIADFFYRSGHSFALCEDDRIPDNNVFRCDTLSMEEGVSQCDAVITVGGDGTLLKVAQTAAKYSKPVLGINTGHLGFLTAIEGNQTELISKIQDYNFFYLKKHNFLEVSVSGDDPVLCLNDAVVSKAVEVNTVNLCVNVNDKPLMKFSGDGLIVSSATGSTAYSLSVGGPVVDSDLAAMVLSPVAPHTLNRTSVVLGSDKTVEIFGSDGFSGTYVSYDGTAHRLLEKDDSIEIKVSDVYLEIYTLKNFGQLEKIDKKLKLR